MPSWGWEGNGPGSGDPRAIGLVLAGRDPVALDAVAGSIVGADPAHLYTIRAAAEAGVGETRLDRIMVHGEPVAGIRVRDFRLPPHEHTEWRLPEWARRTLKDALTTRPVIDHAECIRCGVCQGHCPQGAIGDTERGLKSGTANAFAVFAARSSARAGRSAWGRAGR